MKWKELLKAFEEEFTKNGCSSEHIQRDLIIHRIVKDVELSEYVKSTLNFCGGFCICEVFLNAIEHIDEEKEIST